MLLSSPLDSVPRLTLRHPCGAELDILSGRGGCLVGWRILHSGNPLELLDGYASETDLNTRYYSSHCGARLSPFPNRVKDGLWIHGGKNYQLDKNFPWENGHAIHGLLFDLPWQQIDAGSDTDTVWALLECDYDGKHPGFPFPYRAKTRYILSADKFAIESSVTNLGAEPLPLGEGWHPYFLPQCPIDQAELHMSPYTMRIEVDDRSIPTGVLTPDDDFSKAVAIGDRNLNTCWKFVGPEGRAEAVLRNPITGLTFHYWQDRVSSGYDYIQLYTPPARRSLAIEPMTCPPDVLNNKMGLILVEPGQEHKMVFGTRVVFDKVND